MTVQIKVEQRDRPPQPKCICWKPAGPPQSDCPAHDKSARTSTVR